jgi:cytochrome c oxidase cbb3-type subunit III
VPTKIEKDVISGQDTTGHEWDGVKELNTPVPKWWLYVFAASILWAFGMFVLYPSFPYGTGYFHGLLGYSTRVAVDAEVDKLVAQRKGSMDKIAAMSFDAVKADPALMEVALTSGRITFAENCQPCHGPGGGGRPAYPALAAGAWIWGGTLADIQQTITHGIRSGDTDARQSMMPRFGADNVLKPAEVEAVASYVWASFYGHPADGQDTTAGAKIFAENCVACHGEQGQGNREMGAPKLASQVHLYGSTRETIANQVTLPRQGVMPNWGTRLDPATIKAVALYVHALGGGE